MNKITPEKTHALLEKLADYVMTEIPAIKEKQENLADYVMTEIPAIKEKQENLADYVMTEIPAIKEKQENLADYVMTKIPAIEEKHEKLADYVVTGFQAIEEKLDQKADKADVRKILDGLDSQGKQLDIIRTEQAATSHAINRMDKRIANLEQNETGYRIRDKEE
jgi:transcriptional regulator of heat shock response